MVTSSSPEAQVSPRPEQIWKTALAGANAGVAGTLLGYPLDNIKTRMQTGAGSKMLRVFGDVVKKEGFWALYVGVANPLAALTILNTLNFSQYSKFRTFYKVRDEVIQKGGFEWKILLAGASVGPMSSLISTPFELVKTQMVLHSNQLGSNRTSAVRSAREIVRTHGFDALFSGHLVNTTREMVFIASYFAIYEHTKKSIAHMATKFGFSSNVAIPLAGGLSGAASWFISFPLDSVKSNIQGAALHERKSRPYATTIAWNIMKERGLRGLYRGAAPSIARAFLVSSSRFTVYEGTLSLLGA